MKIGDYVFTTEPMEHQARALKAIIQRKGTCALLMDPGTGKTKPVIDYLGLLWTKYGQIDWLVAAPLSALDTWPEEIRKHLSPEVPHTLVQLDDRYSIAQKVHRIEQLGNDSDHLTLRIVIINHDAFASRARYKGMATKTMQDALVEAIELWRPDGITVDESQRIKTHTANRSVGFRRVGKLTRRRQILTGTVSPKNPLDIYGQWMFLNPERFDKRWTDFQQKYAVWGGFEKRQPVKFIRQDEMRKKIQADAFIATKEECLDLPEYTDKTLPVHLSKEEIETYRDMGDKLIAELPSGNKAIAPIVLTKVLRMRQITGGFLGYEDDKWRKKTEILGNSKLNVLGDLLVDLIDAQEKVVVFAHFKPDIQRIHEMVERRFKKVPLFRIEGATGQKSRLSQRQAFARTSGAAVFVSQQRTMSLAVNELVAASHAVFYSLSERRDDYDQARDRLHRHGQTRPVTFHHLVVPNSVDSLLLSAHWEKIELEQALLSSPHTLRLREEE